MSQKYYQQTLHITGQTATHASSRNWLLQLDVGDILIIGEQRAAITSIDSGNSLTFLGVLPAGAQVADFEVSNEGVFHYYAKGNPSTGVQIPTPKTYPARAACVRCDIGSQGEQGIPGGRGGQGEPGPQGDPGTPGTAATSLDALTDVVATPAMDGQAYTLLKQNGIFTLAPAVTDVTDEWVTNW